MKTRKALFAGSWYPAGARECEKEIEGFLKEGENAQPGRDDLSGGIVPHAGWFFSGGIACNVIRALQEGPTPDALIIFGMHLHAGSPHFIMTEGAWETPFGAVDIESRIAGPLAERFSFRIETAEIYTQDNTIELQLPFVKYFFPEAGIVPAGPAPNAAVLDIAKAAVEIAGDLGLRIKVLGSTDLTHYGFNYGFTPKGTGAKALKWMRESNDKRLIEALLAMDPSGVIAEARENHNACCAGAAAAAVAAGKRLGAEKAELLRYATSYDKSPGDSFVGYAGIVF